MHRLRCWLLFQKHLGFHVHCLRSREVLPCKNGWVLLLPCRDLHAVHKCLCVSVLSGRDVSEPACHASMHILCRGHFRCLEDRRMQQLQRGLLRPVHQCYRMQCVPQRDVPRLSRGERMFFVCSRDLFTDQKRHMHQMCSRHVHAIFQFLWLHVVYSWHLSDAARDDFMHTLFTRHVFAK